MTADLDVKVMIFFNLKLRNGEKESYHRETACDTLHITQAIVVNCYTE